jgi:flagellar hook assembly protein FlgD
MQVGLHQLTWNTKDEKGNAVAPGVYFLKLNTGEISETKKIVIGH